MHSIIYATFRDSDKVDQAFVDLLQLGVDPQDLIVLTRRSYRDPALHVDGGLPGVTGHAHSGPYVAEDGVSQDAQAEPGRHTPFADETGGIGIEDSLESEGDLTSRFIELGFGNQMAANLENTVIDGGAILIMRSPSGAIDDVQAWAVVERSGGTGLAQMRSGPYVG